MSLIRQGLTVLHVVFFFCQNAEVTCLTTRLRHIRFLSGDSESDVSGPVVKDSDLRKAAGTAGPSPPPPPPVNGNTTIAALIDKALKHEFSDETAKASAGEAALAFNSTTTGEEVSQGVLETVIRISGKREAETDTSTSSGPHNATAAGSTVADGAKEETSLSSSMQISSSGNAVDRIIDNKNNEFILSKVGSDAVASLIVDPQFIQDITAVLATCAVFGILFEIIQQPVINGYLVAGAVLGPGGMEIIQELVQVESLAQLGVQLLLFNLGLELSMSKLRAVYGVAIFGGCLQILLSMMLTGSLAAFVGVSVSQGIFIGAILSMSSTSVVVKCLETTRSTNTQYGQITIGTLILQDCCVGLMFALLPVFRSQNDNPLSAAQPAENRAVIVIMVLQVLFKLAAAVVLAIVVSKTLVTLLLRMLYRYGSTELVQLSLVAICLSMSWISHHYGISSELGAFIAGAMVAHAYSLSGLTGGSSTGGTSVVLQLIMNPGPRSSESSGHHTLEPHKLIESLHNVMTALFVASIGLMTSPTFLWDHITILTAGTVCVVLVKSLLVTCVVRAFGIGLRTSFIIGITMAHIGEFSLVLLSMAMQLKFLSAEVYMLLLGVTALSLLTTPMVIMVTHSLLRDRTDSHVSIGARGQGNTRHTSSGGSPHSGSDAKLLPDSQPNNHLGPQGGFSTSSGQVVTGGTDLAEASPLWLDPDSWRRKPQTRTGRQPNCPD